VNERRRPRGDGRACLQGEGMGAGMSSGGREVGRCVENRGYVRGGRERLEIESRGPLSCHVAHRYHLCGVGNTPLLDIEFPISTFSTSQLDRTGTLLGRRERRGRPSPDPTSEKTTEVESPYGKAR